MKIGIYAGTIPPPIFIQNLVEGLSKGDKQIFLYGNQSLRTNDMPFFSDNLTLRIFPSSRIGILLYFMFYLIKLIIRCPLSFLNIITKIKKNATDWGNFFYRCCRIVPLFTDNLDLLHIQWAKTLVYYPEFIEHITCPILVSLRGAHINYSPIVDKKLAKGYKKYFPFVAGFHAVSNAIAIEAQKYNAKSSKINIIRPAVKHNLINYKPRIYLKKERLNIVSIGRCHWKKGYTVALDAMSLLKQKHINFHYTIIADGYDNENIIYQIHDLGLRQNVSFINGLKHNDLMNKLSEMDIFLLSSYEEGISNSVLEAMAQGVPVIVSDCGGMKELIKNGENGFLVPIRDSESISLVLQKFVLLDEVYKKKIINNARKTILQDYLLDNQIKLFDLYYRTLVKH